MDHVANQQKTEALALRYGADAVPAAGPWNDHIALLLSHRSVRGYRPDAPPEGTLETLVATAQSAATSSNMQTWSVLSVNNPAARAELARIANDQKHIQQCPLFLVWLADVARNQRVAAEEGETLEAAPYLEAFLVAAIDAALAAQNAVVAAESLGLSTVYIGALRNEPETVSRLLGLPDGVVCLFGLCIGSAAEATSNEVKPRLPQSIVLHHETYATTGETAERHAYDLRMGAFSRRNEVSADDWTRRVIRRMGKIKAMNGRHTLRSTLERLGYPLR